jgi:allophanate hydrolase
MEAVLERIAACPDRAVFIDLLSRDEIDRQIERLTQVQQMAAFSRDMPLFGVPFAVKDNIDVSGRPTTAACPAFSYTPAQSALVVRKLCDAGAIVIGKTNLDQFATGLVGMRSPYGACFNPFDDRYISGGSSSGSAVAVSRGLVTFSLGTDTAGSGRVPAAFNNIVGIKPSRGLLSATGVVPACQSLDCVSIFALTAPDAWKIVTHAMGFDGVDPYSRAASDFRSRQIPMRFRFGVGRPEQLDFMGNYDTQRQYHAAVGRLESMGGTPIMVDCQPMYEAGKLLYEGPWVAERFGGLRKFLEAHPYDVLPVIDSIVSRGSGYDGAASFDGLHKLATLQQAARSIWAQIDVLLLPTAGTIYTQAEIERDPVGLNLNLGRYTTFVNLMDLCAIAVPAGFGRDNLPVGVSLIAPAGQDARLAEIGDSLHRAAKLNLGATGVPMPQSPPFHASPEDQVLLAVVGAHLSGEPLNGQLTSRGANLIRSCKTWQGYKLFALAGTKPAKPGLLRVDDDSGYAIEVEVWGMSTAAFGSFVAEVPPPMAIGTIKLEDGSQVKGFLCEPYGMNGASDISHFGGWRAYRRSQ